MALLQNGYRDFSSGVRIFGATVSNSAYPYALHRKPASTQRNLTAGEGISSNLAGVPSGYRNQYTWIMPQSPGALGSRNQISGAGAFSGAIAGGVNGQATLSGTGDLAGVGALIISLVAALSGSGTISNAAADAFLQLAASLAGQGDLVGSLTAIGHAEAALSGSGDADGTATALGTLAASITVTGDLLTTANVGGAVWGALAAANNTPGTMGEKLNDAGSASNPWTEVIESGYTAAEILRLIASATAGKMSGANSNTVTFRDLGDTKDRIVADVDATGRTDVTLDPT